MLGEKGIQHTCNKQLSVVRIESQRRHLSAGPPLLNHLES